MGAALTIDSVALSADGSPPQRAEQIAWKTFALLERRFAGERGRLLATGELPGLYLPAVEVDWDAMDDDTIARLCADAIISRLQAE